MSRIDAALSRLRQLSAVQQRRAACLLGAVVADVAITPLHWIYDQSKVAGLVASGVVEFAPKSECPFYHVPPGEPSAYGVQLQVTMEGLIADNGLDTANQADRLYNHFGPGTPFEATRKQTASPKQGCWTNHNLKTFMAKREEKEADQSDTGSKDPDGLVKAIAVLAMYHGRENMMEQVEACVRVTQSNPVAVCYAKAGAAILSGVVGTGEPSLDKVYSDLKNSADNRDHDIANVIDKAKAAIATKHTDFVKQEGLACGMPPSFLGMIHGITTAESYTAAVRGEILAAGDNCSRVAFVGAYMGAKSGLDSIPVEWIKKVNRMEQMIEWVETIAKF